MSDFKKNENYHIKSTKAKIKNQAIYVSSNQKNSPKQTDPETREKGRFYTLSERQMKRTNYAVWKRDCILRPLQ